MLQHCCANPSNIRDALAHKFTLNLAHQLHAGFCCLHHRSVIRRNTMQILERLQERIALHWAKSLVLTISSTPVGRRGISVLVFSNKGSITMVTRLLRGSVWVEWVAYEVETITENGSETPKYREHSISYVGGARATRYPRPTAHFSMT